jgi:hypothetical protein
MQSSTDDDIGSHNELLKFQQDLLKLEQEQDRPQETGQPRAKITRIRIEDLLNHEPTTTGSRSGERDDE